MLKFLQANQQVALSNQNLKGRAYTEFQVASDPNRDAAALLCSQLTLTDHFAIQHVSRSLLFHIHHGRSIRDGACPIRCSQRLSPGRALYRVALLRYG